MKTVLIDDELHCIETLRFQLLQYPQLQVVESFTNSTEALTYVNNHTIDVLFLDIQMPQLNGIAFAKALIPQNIQIIFTTAFDNYAIQAIKLAAFDYLLKPIDEEDLQTCIKRLTLANRQQQQTQLQLLQQVLTNPQHLPDKIALPTDNGLVFVNVNQIIRCQSNNNYTYVYCNNKPNALLICRSLKDVEAVLQPYGFLRVHQSHLVNVLFLEMYSRYDGGFVKLHTGDTIPVTRWHKEQVEKYFNKL